MVCFSQIESIISHGLTLKEDLLGTRNKISGTGAYIHYIYNESII